MVGVLSVMVTLLLIALLGGLVRILRGPTRADRMLAAQLFGTTGVAILLILAELIRVPALRNVALVFAVLAAVNAVVFASGSRGPRSGRRA